MFMRFLACQGPIMSRIRRIASGDLTTHSRQALTIVRLRFTEWRSSTPRSGHKPIERCSVIRVGPFWGHRGVVGTAFLLFRLITGPYTVRSMPRRTRGARAEPLTGARIHRIRLTMHIWPFFWRYQYSFRQNVTDIRASREAAYFSVASIWRRRTRREIER